MFASANLNNVIESSDCFLIKKISLKDILSMLQKPDVSKTNAYKINKLMLYIVLS